MEKTTRQLKGVVASDKMNKTIVVVVSRRRQHPKYLKMYTVSQRYKCHDENNEAKKGDTVVIEAYRPMSKDKRWKLTRVVSSASPE
jgi:small subunit ribosomal protein S17